MKKARIPKDKQYHIIALLAGTLAIALTTKNLALAVILGITVSIGKEVWDYYMGGVASWGDMAANAIGICLAVIVFATIQAMRTEEK